jgi:hypothetical protein
MLPVFSQLGAYLKGEQTLDGHQGIDTHGSQNIKESALIYI